MDRLGNARCADQSCCFGWAAAPVAGSAASGGRKRGSLPRSSSTGACGTGFTTPRGFANAAVVASRRDMKTMLERIMARLPLRQDEPLGPPALLVRATRKPILRHLSAAVQFTM